MKEQLITLIKQALASLQQQGELPLELKIGVQVTPARGQHGDYASNIALVCAKQVGLAPRELAHALRDAMHDAALVERIEIAGPGFINFFLRDSAHQQVVADILEQAEQYGGSEYGAGQKVHMEYVSANPTGPLHVGHGRSAAYGACVANILRAVGYQVHREYYVNDSGRQMRILAMSVWVRYLQLQTEAVVLPAGAYQGEYIKAIAQQLKAQYKGRFHHTQESLESLLVDVNDQDKEKYLDYWVDMAKKILGEANFALIFKVALNYILADIQDDLAEFGVEYDQWFHESQLFQEGLVESGIELLEKGEYTYKKDGAVWFKSTAFGDEKDRVLIRDNGQPTYFASDVAYHFYKYQQGYDQVLDVLGSDHHGYIGRIRAFLTALKQDPEKFHVLLVQFAILYRGDQKVPMSTRQGEFVTLRQLRDEVGNDAARFFYVMRKPEQHLDFDLELAKSNSQQNPVYYIQYAHARICSIWRQLAERKLKRQQTLGLAHLALLNSQHEMALLSQLARYPDCIQQAASHYAPHLVAHYLLELANSFHSYYNAQKFLIEALELREARLCLIAAVQQVLRNGLCLLGVSCPEQM